MKPTQRALDLAETIEVLACLDYQEGELQAFLDRVARGFSRVLGVDWTVITLVEDLRTYRVAGNSSSAWDTGDTAFALHGSVTARVIDGGAPYWVADAREGAQDVAMPEEFVAYLGVPLKTASGNVIGTVCSFDRAARDFDNEDVAVARVFAARAAAAIEQYRTTLALAAHNERLEQAVEHRTSELRAAQQRLIRRERLAAIGELSAKIVHEVRSPLSTMTMALDHLSQVDLPESSSRRLALAREDADRLNRLLGEILSYAAPSTGNRQWVDVNALVARTADAYNDAYGAANGTRRVRCRCCSDLPGVLANPDKLRQVLINLLDNAVDASLVGADVVVETGTADDQGLVSIRVRNRATQGRLDADRALEPFYSTKPQGTGLGLAIVAGIVEAHQGRFLIEQDAAGEVTAQVILPTWVEAADEASVPTICGRSARSLQEFSHSMPWRT
ncbi:MAG: GAF domain-containing protein [Gammaproteobacteria bacterium]|nr:GAF domain-containing protein [Gammaproteobacteria bacterium]